MGDDLTDTTRRARDRIYKEHKGLLMGIANVILSWATVETIW